VKGKTIGVDATTLEANAALRSIVRRDSGDKYDEVLTRLAKASGIGTPTRADLARIDRKRKKKGSHDDWTHPHDPDATITKMKDGRTHLAHKAEHAIDLETGAIVGITVQDADEGDTTTIQQTLPEVAEQLEAVGAVTDGVVGVIEEVVADKGYHSRTTAHDLEALEIRTYISEPDRGPQSWIDQAAQRDAVYASAFNLSLWMRTLFGIGTRAPSKAGWLRSRPCSARYGAFTLDAIGRGWRQSVPLMPSWVRDRVARLSVKTHLHHGQLDVAEPPVFPPCLHAGHPAAQRIESDEDKGPHYVDVRQRQSVTGGKKSAVHGHLARLESLTHADRDGQRMYQVDMGYVERERHASECDQRSPHHLRHTIGHGTQDRGRSERHQQVEQARRVLAGVQEIDRRSHRTAA